MYLTDRGRRDDPRPAGPRQRVAGTVVLLGLVSLCTDVSSESVSAVLPLYLTTVIGLGPLGYGFIDGLYQGVSALVRISGGWAADRFDHPKRVAVAGYALSAVSRLALIPATGLAAITAIIGVDRIGKGIRTAPRDSIIAASSDPAAYGRAFGVHRALDTLGAAIGPFVAFALLVQLPDDFQAVFVVSFGAACVGLAMLLLLVPDLRPRRETGRGTPRPVRTVRRLVNDASVRRIVYATALLGLCTIGDGFIYLGLRDRDGFALEYFPLLYVGTNVAYMVLAVPMGRIADRLGRAGVFLAGHVALIAAYLCAGGGVSGAAATTACLLLLGGYYAATDGQLAAMTSQAVDPSVRGTAIATTQTTQALARFGSSLLFGALWVGIGQSAALVVVTIVLAVALLAAWLLLRTPTSGRAAPAGRVA